MMVYLDEFGNFTSTPPDENAKKKEIDPSKIQLGAAVVEEFNLDELRKGKIDFFNHEKGFGFIIESETSEKYFVHINNVKYEGIDAGHKVHFQLEEGFKGLSAINVDKIDLKKEADDKAAAKAASETEASETEVTAEVKDANKGDEGTEEAEKPA
jgi:cold shock CspA family protein